MEPIGPHQQKLKWVILLENRKFSLASFVLANFSICLAVALLWQRSKWEKAERQILHYEEFIGIPADRDRYWLKSVDFGLQDDEYSEAFFLRVGAFQRCDLSVIIFKNGLQTSSKTIQLRSLDSVLSISRPGGEPVINFIISDFRGDRLLTRIESEVAWLRQTAFSEAPIDGRLQNAFLIMEKEDFITVDRRAFTNAMASLESFQDFCKWNAYDAVVLRLRR